jgi:hypothetical protein
MSAPASTSARAASAAVLPSEVRGSFSKEIVTITGRPVFFARSTARSASPSHENVSPITKSMPSSTCTASCSSKVARTLSRDEGLSGSYIQVRLMLPATRQRSPATLRAMRTAARFRSARRSSRPTVASLSRLA